jgi:hypothetical protein
MWNYKVSRQTLTKKGALHDFLLRLKIKQYQKFKDVKVIRLDCSYTPDAIVVDWEKRKVTALEVETSRNTHYYLKGHYTRGKKKENRPDFDDVTLVMVGRSRRTVKEFNAVAKLRKAQLSLRKISEKTGVSVDVIRDWVYRGRKPPFMRKRKRLEEAGVNLEVIPLTIMGE